ncbi:hypothetical protein KKD52_18160 [Myxococcota bacterium]|nr:hypothetical protein [Myxococcota bacterium]MBU1411644.1 hypothetical protein [Myxococcota bacterium]MBU1512279.1 hypothetical protein [Myxococcota bacterium]
MRYTLALFFFGLGILGTTGAWAVCPKDNQMKMREAVMRAIEKIEAYDHQDGLDLVKGGIKYAAGDCVSTEHALNLKQLQGIALFYLNQKAPAREALMELFKLQEDAKLIEKVANPKLAAFFAQVLAEYKKQIQQKADTKAKIKELEDATGMPPEPAEDTTVPIEHTPREKGQRGRGLTVFCRVKDDLKAAKVLLFLETTAGNFSEIEMKKVGVRRYVSSLTPQQTATPLLKYYLMVFSAENKPVAASGNSAKPHIVPMEIPSDPGTTTPEKDPVTDPGKDPVTDPGKDPGTDPGKDPGTDPGKDPVTDPGKDPGKKPTNQVMEDDTVQKPVEDEPDEFKKARKAMTARPAWDAGAEPMFFLFAGYGFSAGLVSDSTEARHAEINTGFGTATMMHLELGYMMNRTTAFSGVFQMGMVPVDTNLRPQDEEYQTTKNDFYFSDSMRNDMRFLLRYKSLGIPMDLGSSLRWRYYWGLGLGGGRLRHAAPASVTDNNVTTEYNDTHFASGTMFNGYGGASLCFTESCGANLTFEISYLSTFSLEPGNSSYAHFDFILGFSLIF